MSQIRMLSVVPMVLKTESGIEPFFFLISGLTLIFDRFFGCWPVLGLLTGPD